MATINAHDFTVGEILTAATMDGVTEDIVAVNTEISNAAHIKTGNYTGDGTISQAITGVGFKPIFLWIFERAADTGAVNVFYTSDNYITTDADGIAVRLISTGNLTGQDNSIISLDADGFTVDDNASNNHPNQNGTVYEYLAFGIGSS